MTYSWRIVWDIRLEKHRRFNLFFFLLTALGLRASPRPHSCASQGRGRPPQPRSRGGQSAPEMSGIAADLFWILQIVRWRGAQSVRDQAETRPALAPSASVRRSRTTSDVFLLSSTAMWPMVLFSSSVRTTVILGPEYTGLVMPCYTVILLYIAYGIAQSSYTSICLYTNNVL